MVLPRHMFNVIGPNPWNLGAAARVLQVSADVFLVVAKNGGNQATRMVMVPIAVGSCFLRLRKGFVTFWY